MTITIIYKLTLNVVGAKKCKTLTADTSSAPVGDSFFNDILSCSDMPNPEDVTCYSLCIKPYKTHHNHFFYFNCLTLPLICLCLMQISTFDLV